MNNTVAESRDLIVELAPELREIEGVEKVVCPPFPALLAVSAMLEGSDIGLGAQNMHGQAKGAFTGEVSPVMVKEYCQYVILGHSERRGLFAETDEQVNGKLRAAQAFDLTPIVCIGETLEQYESGKTREVVGAQARNSLAGVDAAFAPRLVIAYEPVWAIGTGRASTGENANSVVADIIRPALAGLFGPQVAQAIRVLYGGSVTAANAAEFFAQPDIDGALVGGASLKAAEFVAITKAAAKSSI